MDRHMPIATPVAPLPSWLKAAVIYLFIPVILFLIGWLKPWISIPVLVSICVSLIAMVARVPFSQRHGLSAANIGTTAGIAMMAISFALFTGLSDWLPQSNDYLKHNLLAGDLVERAWPVRYQSGQDNFYLCYGLGYYLLPAGISKVVGIQWLGTTSSLWALLGLFLFFLGLRRHFERFRTLGIALFLLSAGLGALWHLSKSGFVQSLVSPTAVGAGPAEMLMGLGLYTSNLDSFTRIFYQPQHCIPGWLGGLVIHELIVSHKRWAEGGAALAATLFWSPLTAVGLGFIGLAALVTDFRTLWPRPSVHLACAVLLTAVLTAYYLPHLPIAEKGFIWEFAKGSDWLPWYLLFLFFFVMIPASAVFWMEKRNPFLGALKPVVVTMTLVLMICPLFKFGYFSDLRMQITGPAFLFLGLAIAKGLVEVPGVKPSAPYFYLVAVFLAGAAFPALRTLDTLVSGRKTDFSVAALRKQGLNDIRNLKMPGFDVSTQYLGRADSAIARWILKNP
jgi:hypothetical protein